MESKHLENIDKVILLAEMTKLIAAKTNCPGCASMVLEQLLGNFALIFAEEQGLLNDPLDVAAAIMAVTQSFQDTLCQLTAIHMQVKGVPKETWDNALEMLLGEEHVDQTASNMAKSKYH